MSSMDMVNEGGDKGMKRNISMSKGMDRKRSQQINYLKISKGAGMGQVNLQYTNNYKKFSLRGYH
jgi:hypothetical protein